MDISECRIKLTDDRSEGNESRLLAFASIVLDNEFAVRDVKVIQGTKGVFVAMPSRKLTDDCPQCGAKSYLQSHYCHRCGCRHDEHRATRGVRAKLHADVAHPISATCRAYIQVAVLAAYREELERSQRPSYVPRHDDLGGDDFEVLYDSHNKA